MSRHRHVRTRTERFERRAARLKIITEANRASGWSAPTFTMRSLQEAVCVARRRALVSDKILVRAGFNPRRIPEPHPLSQGRRGPGSPASPPQAGDRAAVEVSGRPPRARGRSARARASAATDPQARERAPLDTSERPAPLRNRRAKTRAGAAGPASGPRPGTPD